MYTVNAWHNVALRAAEKLKIGQFVMLRGYLTQRLIQANELSYTLTELMVRDFVSSAQRQEIDEGVQEKSQSDSAAQTVETEGAVEA